jgi:hypothetical protein
VLGEFFNKLFILPERIICEGDGVLERDAHLQNIRWALRVWTLDSDGEILEIERTVRDEYRTWH